MKRPLVLVTATSRDIPRGLNDSAIGGDDANAAIDLTTIKSGLGRNASLAA